MHLYLREQPVRTLLLTTSSEDERRGCPRRALIFRAEGIKAASQATVEFVPKDEVDFTGLVRLTARQVHGCLGLINIANGMVYGIIYVTRSDAS
jgi:synaptojanin